MGWTEAEDDRILIAWQCQTINEMNRVEATGVVQPHEEFWNGVCVHYLLCPPSAEPRSVSAISHRWHYLVNRANE